MNSGLRGRQKKKMLNTYSRMKQNDKIYVAGHSGLVGGALVRLLKARGFNNLITRSRAEVDLRDERAVRNFFAEERPDLAVLAAAKVGGIKANIDAPVEFLIENLQIQTTLFTQRTRLVRANFFSSAARVSFRNLQHNQFRRG